MNFETLTEALNERGFLISDCFQRGESEWIVSVRRPGEFSTAHGEGSSPSIALSRAMVKIKPAIDWQKVKVGRPQEPRYRIERKG